MDRGSWYATVHGVAKNQIRLKDFTFFTKCLPSKNVISPVTIYSVWHWWFLKNLPVLDIINLFILTIWKLKSIFPLNLTCTRYYQPIPFWSMGVKIFHCHFSIPHFSMKCFHTFLVMYVSSTMSWLAFIFFVFFLNSLVFLINF